MSVIAETITNIIQQTPPGQTSNVVQDVEKLFHDSPDAQNLIRDAVAKLQMSQNRVIHSEADNSNILLTDDSLVSESKDRLQDLHYDPQNGKVYQVDYLKDNITPYPLPHIEDSSKLVKELSESLGAYAKNHYPDVHYAIYSTALLPRLGIYLQNQNETQDTPSSSSGGQNSTAENIKAQFFGNKPPLRLLDPATPLVSPFVEKSHIFPPVNTTLANPAVLRLNEKYVRTPAAGSPVDQLTENPLSTASKPPALNPAVLRLNEKYVRTPAMGSPVDQPTVNPLSAATDGTTKNPTILRLNEKYVRTPALLTPVDQPAVNPISTATEALDKSQSDKDEDKPTEGVEALNKTQMNEAQGGPSNSLVEETQGSQEEIPDTRFIFYLVGEKHSPKNFWTGSWASRYEINTVEKKLIGKINVKVHYFEHGNIQLDSTLNTETNYENDNDRMSEANKVKEAIKKNEEQVFEQIQKKLDNLNENELRQLRRALPVTRSRVDWDKVSTLRFQAN